MLLKLFDLNQGCPKCASRCGPFEKFLRPATGLEICYKFNFIAEGKKSELNTTSNLTKHRFLRPKLTSEFGDGFFWSSPNFHRKLHQILLGPTITSPAKNYYKFCAALIMQSAHAQKSVMPSVSQKL